MTNGNKIGAAMAIKTEAYRMKAVESYQAMVDALILTRPLAIRACDEEAIAAIDKALAAAGRPQS